MRTTIRFWHARLMLRPTQSSLGIRTYCRSASINVYQSLRQKFSGSSFGRLITLSRVKRQLRLTRIIFAALAPDLVAFAQRGEDVADRHFARLVALETRPLQNVAAGQAISGANKA